VRHTKMSNRKFASIFTPLAGAENPAQIRPESPPTHPSRPAKIGARSAGFQARKRSQGRNWAAKFTDLTARRIHITKSTLLTETKEVRYAMQNRNHHRPGPEESGMEERTSRSPQLENPWSVQNQIDRAKSRDASGDQIRVRSGTWRS